MLIKRARDLGFDVNAAIAAAKESQGIRDTQRSHDEVRRAADARRPPSPSARARMLYRPGL